MTNFYKYEGAGNDFIMMNNLNKNLNFKEKQIKSLCDRHFGIGADGLILLEPSSKADCFMNYYNSDGTIAEMCGNGIRCVAKFYQQQTDSKLGVVTVETRSGIKKIVVNDDDTYSVEMGSPKFESLDFVKNKININNMDFMCVSMGNPHAVTFTGNLNEIEIEKIGPKVEIHSNFPNKINAEFIEKIDDMHFKVKVWERGCGETLACGTGACAVYSIITENFNRENLATYTDEEIKLEFQGGDLFISKNEQNLITLRGPARFIYKGEINKFL